jgi:branched-chain amino acid transport system ATP-binding protein
LSLLEVVDVTQAFGGVKALSEVTVEFTAGEVHAVIGPNGAGKTTLFDIISGIRRPTSGRVVLEGVDVTRRTAVARARRGVRRTFQRQQPIGWLSVEDNVLAALDWHGGGGGTVADLFSLPSRTRRERDRRATAMQLLELCELTSIRSTLAGQLTIGQARMLELARALVDRPKLLLLDEPTSGLGPGGIAQVSRIIERARADGCAIGLVEHDVSFVAAVSDRISVMTFGRVVATGSPTDVLASPEVQEAYLGEVSTIAAPSLPAARTPQPRS